MEAHHLIEKRFAKNLELKKGEMASIVVTKDEHSVFTEKWRQLIPYSNSKANITTENASQEQIMDAAREVYKDYPELLNLIEQCIKGSK